MNLTRVDRENGNQRGTAARISISFDLGIELFP